MDYLKVLLLRLNKKNFLLENKIRNWFYKMKQQKIEILDWNIFMINKSESLFLKIILVISIIKVEFGIIYQMKFKYSQEWYLNTTKLFFKFLNWIVNQTEFYLYYYYIIYSNFIYFKYFNFYFKIILFQLNI